MDDNGHPDGAQIERFVRCKTSPRENRSVVHHLLRGCLKCQEAANSVWPEIEPPPVRLEPGKRVA